MSNVVHPIKLKADRDAIKAHLTGRDRLLFTIGISLGLRITDLLSLRIGDLRDQHYYVIKEGKTKKARKLHITETIRNEMAELEGPDEEYIFKSRKGHNQPITRIQAHRILSEAAEKSGVKHRIGAIGGHSLRKTFGFLLYEQGLDITRIQSALNHSSQAVTLRYIGVEESEINAAIDAIDV